MLQTEGTGLSPASEQDPSSPLGAALHSALKSSPVASSVVLAQTLRMPCGGLRGTGGGCVLRGQACPPGAAPTRGLEEPNPEWEQRW